MLTIVLCAVIAGVLARIFPTWAEYLPFFLGDAIALSNKDGHRARGILTCGALGGLLGACIACGLGEDGEYLQSVSKIEIVKLHRDGENYLFTESISGKLVPGIVAVEDSEVAFTTGPPMLATSDWKLKAQWMNYWALTVEPPRYRFYIPLNDQDFKS